MKKYAINSPEAMARILVMQMVCDGNFNPEELEELEHLHVYEAIGISRKGFIQVLHDYCNDISDEADEEGRISLINRERIDYILDSVSEPKNDCKSQQWHWTYLNQIKLLTMPSWLYLAICLATGASLWDSLQSAFES